MNRRQFALVTALTVLPFLTGCGTSIKLDRADTDLAGQLESSRFFFVFDDGTESAPDNWDGHINLIWTGDEKRDEIVAVQVHRLLHELNLSGFTLVQEQSESNVVARLKLKSVRFDPIGGWITDDASLTFSATVDDENLGSVVVDEVWVTPKLKWVIDALVLGSRQLWGVEESD